MDGSEYRGTLQGSTHHSALCQYVVVHFGLAWHQHIAVEFLARAPRIVQNNEPAAVADVVDVDEPRVAESNGVSHSVTVLLPSAAGAGEKQEDREAKEYVT